MPGIRCAMRPCTGSHYSRATRVSGRISASSLHRCHRQMPDNHRGRVRHRTAQGAFPPHSAIRLCTVASSSCVESLCRRSGRLTRCALGRRRSGQARRARTRIYGVEPSYGVWLRRNSSCGSFSVWRLLLLDVLARDGKRRAGARQMPSAARLCVWKPATSARTTNGCHSVTFKLPVCLSAAGRSRPAPNRSRCVSVGLGCAGLAPGSEQRDASSHGCDEWSFRRLMEGRLPPLRNAPVLPVLHRCRRSGHRGIGLGFLREVSCVLCGAAVNFPDTGSIRCMGMWRRGQRRQGRRDHHSVLRDRHLVREGRDTPVGARRADGLRID